MARKKKAMVKSQKTVAAEVATVLGRMSKTLHGARLLPEALRVSGRIAKDDLAAFISDATRHGFLKRLTSGHLYFTDSGRACLSQRPSGGESKSSKRRKKAPPIKKKIVFRDPEEADFEAARLIEIKLIEGGKDPNSAVFARFRLIEWLKGSDVVFSDLVACQLLLDAGRGRWKLNIALLHPEQNADDETPVEGEQAAKPAAPSWPLSTLPRSRPTFREDGMVEVVGSVDWSVRSRNWAALAEKAQAEVRAREAAAAARAAKVFAAPIGQEGSPPPGWGEGPVHSDADSADQTEQAQAEDSQPEIQDADEPIEPEAADPDETEEVEDEPAAEDSEPATSEADDESSEEEGAEPEQAEDKPDEKASTELKDGTAREDGAVLYRGFWVMDEIPGLRPFAQDRVRKMFLKSDGQPFPSSAIKEFLKVISPPMSYPQWRSAVQQGGVLDAAYSYASKEGKRGGIYTPGVVLRSWVDELYEQRAATSTELTDGTVREDGAVWYKGFWTREYIRLPPMGYNRGLEIFLASDGQLFRSEDCKALRAKTSSNMSSQDWRNAKVQGELIVQGVFIYTPRNSRYGSYVPGVVPRSWVDKLMMQRESQNASEAA